MILCHDCEQRTESKSLQECSQEMEAFRAAHTMKGMCQNMAFTRLYQSSHEITEILRGKDLEAAKKMLDVVTEDYNIVIAGIGKLLEQE